jgi:hypothetical protein
VKSVRGATVELPPKKASEEEQGETKLNATFAWCASLVFANLLQKAQKHFFTFVEDFSYYAGEKR